MPAQPHHGPGVSPSQRKLKSIPKLQNLAAKLSDGTDYNLQRYIISGVTLDRVREELSQINGSLADVVIDERAH